MTLILKCSKEPRTGPVLVSCLVPTAGLFTALLKATTVELIEDMKGAVSSEQFMKSSEREEIERRENVHSWCLIHTAHSRV
jgi:hypothetical protein